MAKIQTLKSFNSYPFYFLIQNGLFLQVLITFFGVGAGQESTVGSKIFAPGFNYIFALAYAIIAFRI